MQYVNMYICSRAAFYFTCLLMKTYENNDPHVPLGLFRQDIPKLGHDLCGASNRKSGGRAELTLQGLCICGAMYIIINIPTMPFHGTVPPL